MPRIEGSHEYRAILSNRHVPVDLSHKSLVRRDKDESLSDLRYLVSYQWYGLQYVITTQGVVERKPHQLWTIIIRAGSVHPSSDTIDHYSVILKGDLEGISRTTHPTSSNSLQSHQLPGVS